MADVDEGNHLKQTLSDALEKGKEHIPDERGPLVCKPKQLEPWRVFKIMSEFVEGFELLSKYGLAASFFGSHVLSFEDGLYKAAEELAGKLAKRGFAVVTGGSTGIMEAANRGAHEAGGASVGLNIHLEATQSLNRYLTESLTFEHFFVRKTMLAFASEVYIFFPGGFGTLDEFYEILTLVQTKKINRIPIVLYGKEFWTPILAHMKDRLLSAYQAIEPGDLELFVLVDTVDEAYDHIVKNVKC